MTCGNLIGSHVISYSIYASDVFTDVTVVLWRKLFPAFDMNVFFFYYYYLLPFSCRSKPNRVCRHLSRLTSEEQLFPPLCLRLKNRKKKKCPADISLIYYELSWPDLFLPFTQWMKVWQNSTEFKVCCCPHRRTSGKWRKMKMRTRITHFNLWIESL